MSSPNEFSPNKMTELTFLVFLVLPLLCPWRAPVLIFFYIILLPVWLFFIYNNKQKILEVFWSDKLTRYIVLFFGYVFLHSFVYLFLFPSMSRLDFFRGLLLTFSFVTFGAIYFSSQTRCIRARNVLFVSVLINCLVSLIMYFLYSGSHGRLMGFALEDNPIIVGGYYGAATFLALDFLRQKKHSFFVALLVYGAIVILTFSVFLTASRGVIAPFIIMLLLFSYIKKVWPVFILIILCVPLLIFIVFTSLIDSHAFFQEIINSNDYFKVLAERGNSYRYEIWGKTLELIKDNFFGYSQLNTIKFSFDTTHPHSLFLSVGYFYGVAGLLIFLLVYQQAIKKLIMYYKHGFNRSLLFIFIFCLFVNVTQQGFIIKTPYSESWYMIWLPLSAILGMSIAFRSLNNNIYKN